MNVFNGGVLMLVIQSRRGVFWGRKSPGKKITVQNSSGAPRVTDHEDLLCHLCDHLEVNTKHRNG